MKEIQSNFAGNKSLPRQNGVGAVRKTSDEKLEFVGGQARSISHQGHGLNDLRRFIVFC